MNVKRSISTVAAATALSATGVAAAADHAVVSPQETIAGTAVVTVPGTGVHKGEWMGSKTVLVARHVTLEAGQKARVSLRAAEGRRIRGIALSQVRFVGARVVERHYVGKGKVTVDLKLSGRAGDGETVVTVYALTR